MPTSQYDLYRGETTIFNIDYENSIGSVAAGNASITSDALDWLNNATWYLGLRAANSAGIQEKNTHVIAKIMTDASGDLIALPPNIVSNLFVTVAGGDDVTVHWIYDNSGEASAPTDFLVYRGASRTSLASVGAAVTYVDGQRAYSLLDSNVSPDGTYYYQVRVRDGDSNEFYSAQFAIAIVDTDTPASVPALEIG